MLNRQRGLSLIELMVSMLIGLLVLAGVSQIFAASFRTNNDSISLTNLNQQIRAVSNIMNAELRRAGYWADAVGDINNGAQTNPFVAVTAVDRVGGDGVSDCVLYGYDMDDDGDATDANEWRGFRWAEDANGRGVIQVKVSGTQAQTIGGDCAGGTWNSLIDSNIIDVTDFTVALNTDFQQIVTNCPGAATEFVVGMRRLDVSLTGELVRDNIFNRTVDWTIRLRNDVAQTQPLAGGC